MKTILLLTSITALLFVTNGCLIFPSHHKTVVVPAAAPAPVIVEPGH